MDEAVRDAGRAPHRASMLRQTNELRGPDKQEGHAWCLKRPWQETMWQTAAMVEPACSTACNTRRVRAGGDGAANSQGTVEPPAGPSLRTTLRLITSTAYQACVSRRLREFGFRAPRLVPTGACRSAIASEHHPRPADTAGPPAAAPLPCPTGARPEP